MTTRSEYIEHLKSRLDEWDAELAKWEAKARVARTDLRIDYEMRLDALRKQGEAAQEKLSQLQGSAGEAWKDMASGADEAWDALQAAYEKARAHFHK